MVTRGEYLSFTTPLSPQLTRNYQVAAGFLSTGCLIIALAPPYGLFVSSLALLGFGSGLYDSCLTTVVSHSEDGVLMSCMYACFGVSSSFSEQSSLADRVHRSERCSRR